MIRLPTAGPMVRVALAAGLTLMVTACAARSGSSDRVSANELTREEIRRYDTAQEAVQALRSNWLRKRTPLRISGATQTGSSPASPVWVYLDGTRLGDTGALRNIQTVEVESIRYLNGRLATNRWGTNHENGVIHVTTRVGP